MAKKNERPVTVTHTEVLGFAIQRLAEFVQKEEDDIRNFGERNPEFAKTIRGSSMWRPKLKILMQMYKFETGTEFGWDYDFDID